MVPKHMLEQGQRVKFYRTHDKQHELTGAIVRVHEDSDLVDIATEPDGRVIEVETIETAHVNDVTPIAELTSISEPVITGSDETAGDSQSGAESTRSRRRR